MQLVVGKIKEVKTEVTNTYMKKEVEIISRYNNRCFVEFRGVYRFLLKKFKTGDEVIIGFKFDGKTSKIGKNFNNLVGTSIEML